MSASRGMTRTAIRDAGSSDQIVLQRVMGELGVRLERHFFQDPGTVDADRLGTDGQVPCDVSQPLARGDEFQYLQFTIRK